MRQRLGHRGPEQLRRSRPSSQVSISDFGHSLQGRSCLVLDCGPPDSVALCKSGNHNGLEIISVARLHGALLKASRSFQPNESVIGFAANALPRNQEYVFLGAEIDIKSGGEVGQESRVGSLDGKARGE